jgi:hypothetical protein
MAGASSNGTLANRPRQAHQAQQVIRAAMHQLDHEISAAWRDQDGIGLARSG